MKLFVCHLFVSSAASYLLKERHDVPPGWKQIRRADKNYMIQLQIGLVQGKIDDLIRNLEEVSDPSHPRYRQYLTASQTNEFARPSQITLDFVDDWLYDHGILADASCYSPARDWITLNLTVGTAEALLQTEYSQFHHENTNSLAVRAPSWSLPAHLHDHIESIQPTTSFFLAASPLRSRQDDNLNQVATEEISAPGTIPSLDLLHLPSDLTVSQACNASAVTPLCIRVLYGILDYRPQAPQLNSMSLVNYSGEFNNITDLDLFLRLYRPDAPRASFTSHSIAGGVNYQTPLNEAQRAQRSGREGALDAQIFLGISSPTPLVTYTVGGDLPPFLPDEHTRINTNEPFLTWLHYMLALPDEKLPKVVATSYGDIESTVPSVYARRVCEGFAMLGLRGVTVIFGAGDWGVGKPELCGAENEAFVSSFPASCPYGTSVAATRGVVKEEVAYNDNNGFVSGGGFSRHFKRPKYQSGKGSVVDAYLDGVVKKTYKGRYQRDGRAYPDVASQGYRRPIVWDAKTYLVDGTSASAPTFAAVVSLVNDALLADGQPPMGFLNPWLYAEGYKAFKDVTTGSTKGCNTTGFHAAPGWDSASGFGTPWFPKFKELALQRRLREQRPWYWPEIEMP